MGTGTQFPALCASAGPAWPRKPCDGRLRHSPVRPVLHPALLPRMWEQGREPQEAAPPHSGSLGERGNFLGRQGGEPAFRGGRAGQASGLGRPANVSSSSSPVLRKPSLSCRPSPTPSCGPPSPEMPSACPGPPLGCPGARAGVWLPQPTRVPQGRGGNLYLCSQNPATGCHLPVPHVHTASSFQELRR